MNVDLLQRVRQHILDYPERFCAAQWAWSRNVGKVVHEGAAPEDFRCCLAGHVLVLGGRFTEAELLRRSVRHDDGYLGRAAGDLLGLTEAQRTTLFYPSQWADPFRSVYYLSADAVRKPALLPASSRSSCTTRLVQPPRRIVRPWHTPPPRVRARPSSRSGMHCYERVTAPLRVGYWNVGC